MATGLPFLNQAWNQRFSARKASVTACALLLVSLAAGCQSGQTPTAMADHSPPQRFAPVAMEPTPVAPPVRTVVVNPNLSNPKPTPRPASVRAAPQAVPAGTPREWVPAVASNSWKWIVVHHSATPVGGAARFGREHQAKGWDELGYHFVIGNGTDTGNGAVEVGSRWPKQKWGAHCKTPGEEFNQHGIGICLVGNFDNSKPTDAQLRALAKLVAYLQKAYKIPADHIIGHGDAKATECPGRNLHIATVRKMSAQMLADAGESAPAPVRTAALSPGQELLTDTRRGR